MQIQIKTTSFEMDSAVQQYLDERLSAIERHMGAVADAARFEVELARDVRNQKTGEIWKAELQRRAITPTAPATSPISPARPCSTF